MSETRPEDSSRYARIEKLPGNSQRKRDEETRPVKEVRQVTAQAATTRKKGLGTRIKESFGGDDARSVGSYLLFDVALPAFQNLVVDAFQQGIERMVLGDSRPNHTRRVAARRPGYTSYNRYSEPTRSGRSLREEPRREFSSRDRATHDFDQIMIQTRGEAEEILDYMGDLLNEYDVVTVTDLYRMVGITGSHVDDNWGWDTLRSARPRRVRDGYVLELPPPVHLDRRI